MTEPAEAAVSDDDRIAPVVPLRPRTGGEPADEVLAAMFTGWRRQQLARNLAVATVDARERLVQRFVAHCNLMPWDWTVAHVDEFFGDLRAVCGLARSSIRSYENALRLFCDYLVDPRYQWASVCTDAFGSHPSQVCFEWNSAAHVQDCERRPTKRAFTREELQAFFDRADEEVGRIRALGRKGCSAALRDATLFKTAYAWGLRRNEVRHLQSVDFTANPHASGFGRFGVCHVRFGKASRGCAPKRRSVLTVWGWSVEVLEQWLAQGRTALPEGLDLFPNERGALVAESALGERFRRYRDELGLDEGLDMHSFRRSYVTHLLEDGVDAMFVQQQVGHQYASTTAIYSCVSSDYRTRVLREALEGCLARAKGTDGQGGSRGSK